jgi:hypothetical protein
MGPDRLGHPTGPATAGPDRLGHPTALAGAGRVTLLTATRDVDHSHAAALAGRSGTNRRSARQLPATAAGCCRRPFQLAGREVGRQP